MGQAKAPSRLSGKTKAAIAAGAAIALALLCLPGGVIGPHPPDLRKRFTEKRESLEALRAAMATVPVGTRVSADQDQHAGTPDKITGDLVRALECNSASREESGAVLVLCYSWGIVGSGIYLGYYHSEETPKFTWVGSHGATASPLEGGWYLYKAK